MDYIKKFGITTNGNKDISIPIVQDYSYIFFSGIISFIGMFCILIIEYNTDFLLVVASFGASAVLIYNTSNVPLAQPRNVIGGHIISSIIGVSCEKLFLLNNGIYYYTPLVGSLAVSLSIILMALTNTIHPPGGATALIAIVGSNTIKKLGFMYILHPITTGITIMVFIAIILNNLYPKKQYPTYWI